MPKIEVPKFRGDFRKFNGWAALFENLVHLNEELDPLKKLHFLKSSLVGPAAELVADTPLTEADYQEAWADVKSSYDIRRIIISAHFKDLLDLKPIRNEGDIGESLIKQKSIMRGLKVSELDSETLGWGG